MVSEVVCVSFLGFDSDRIYKPFHKYRGARLYIIKRRKRDHETAEYNYKKIRENVPRRCIRLLIVEDDVFVRINCLRKIFEKERGNQVYLNLSTGSKLDAIAGMLAVMLFNKERKIIPFYAHPKGSGRGRSKKFFSETSGLTRIQEVPTLDLQKPENGCHDALKILFENRHPTRRQEFVPMRKQELVASLCKNNWIEGYTYINGAGFVKLDKLEYVKRELAAGKRPQRIPEFRRGAAGAIHSAENNIFRPLRNTWGVISEEDRPKNKKISLTENGKHMCKMFFGSVD